MPLKLTSPKRLKRIADDYCDKRAQYEALDVAIEELTKQRSRLVNEATSIYELATPQQQKAIRDEAVRRGLIK